METPQVNTPFWLDKALWVAVLTPILSWLNLKLGTDMQPLDVVALILPPVAYIVMQKYSSAKKASAVIAANAGVAAVAPGQPTGLNQ